MLEKGNEKIEKKFDIVNILQKISKLKKKVKLMNVNDVSNKKSLKKTINLDDDLSQILNKQ